MKELSIFSAQGSASFQILYCVLVRFSRTPKRTMHGNKDWDGSDHLRNTETLTELTVSQWNSSGIFFRETIRCSSVKKSKVHCSDKARHQRISLDGLSMFNDIYCGSKDNEKECGSNANLVSLFAKRFGAGQWSFLGPGSEKKWYSISEDSPQENGTKWRKR